MNMPANEGRRPDNERTLKPGGGYCSFHQVCPGVRCLIPTFLSVLRIPVLWRRISVYNMLWRTHCAVIPDYLLGGTSYIPLQAVSIHSFSDLPYLLPQVRR